MPNMQNFSIPSFDLYNEVITRTVSKRERLYQSSSFGKIYLPNEKLGTISAHFLKASATRAPFAPMYVPTPDYVRDILKQADGKSALDDFKTAAKVGLL